MRRQGVVAALLLALACRKPAPPADLVAEARSGGVRLADVERALNAAAAGPGGAKPAADLAAQVQRYRQAAEDLVVERSLLADLKDLDETLTGLGKEYEDIRRQVVVERWEREAEAAQPVRVTEQEIKQYFGAHPQEFHRAAQRFVWHIFRKDEDPAHPEATLAFLRDLKRRVEAGESFKLMARQYSQSETRLLDGKLGMIGRSRLPKPLSDVVFALPEGGVSDPVPVKGGALLFQVTDVFEEKSYPLEDVRLLIATKLQREKRRQRLVEELGDRKPPAGAVLLDPETMAREVESGDENDLVLSVGETRLTVKEFREAFAKLPPERGGVLPAPQPGERQADLYERLSQQALLFDKLEAEGFTSAPQRRRAIEERERALGRQALIRQRLEERIWSKVDADAAALERFHRDNAFLYQSPLRLKVKTLSFPLGPDAPAKLAQLEGLRAQLQQGKLDFEEAARRSGGRVKDSGWLSPAGLDALEPKVRFYLLDLNGTGYTVPFQLNQQINLAWVEKRDEPRLLPYERVKSRVRQDYHDRKQQELYRAVVQDLLRAEGFQFHEQAVRRALAAQPAQG